MNALVSRLSAANHTPRDIIFDAYDWRSVSNASSVGGQAKPHWKGMSVHGGWVFILPDSWEEIEMTAFAQMWNRKLASFDLTEPEARVLANRLPPLLPLPDETVNSEKRSASESTSRTG